MKNVLRRTFCGAVASCLLLSHALAADIRPDREAITLAKGENIASFTLRLKNDKAFAGAEFGLKVSGGALASAPEVEYLETAGAASQIKALKDGIFYFGFFGSSNEFQADREYPVAKLNYRYSGSAPASVELVHSKIVSISENDSTVGDESSSGFRVTISRDQSGSDGGSGKGGGGGSASGGGGTVSGGGGGTAGGGSAAAAPAGSSAKVPEGASGGIASAEVNISAQTIKDASAASGYVSLPFALSADASTPVTVTLPKGAGRVKISVPMKEPLKPGYAVAVVKEDGSEEIIKTSIVGREGVLITLDRSATIKVVDNTRSFYDVASDNWYANAVVWASSRGVMNGFGTHMFAPEEKTNRAMMAQIVYNLANAGSSNITSRFSDVSETDWFGKGVTWAVENGIARSEDDHFGALDPLTREDMVFFLYNYAKYAGIDTSASGDISAFGDGKELSDWATPAMRWAVGAGLISGTQNGTRTIVLDPKGTATRAQMATILERFCKIVLENPL